jgi:hypothetical protein
MNPNTPQRGLWWTATGLAAISVILVIFNVIMVMGNQTRQAEVAQRQQFINQSVQLGRLNQNLVNLLAQAAVKNGDAEIQQMLTANGITVSANAPVESGTPASAPAPAPAPAQVPTVKPPGK